MELVEQPVARWDLDGLAWVSDRVDLPILADEAVFGVRDLVEVIRRRAADLVNVKLAKCGGLHPARTLLDLAAAHGMGTIVGSMMESQVGIGAAASLVAAYGTTRGVRPGRRLVAGLVAGAGRDPVRRRDGACCPTRPGSASSVTEVKCRPWLMTVGFFHRVA